MDVGESSRRHRRTVFLIFFVALAKEFGGFPPPPEYALTITFFSNVLLSFYEINNDHEKNSKYFDRFRANWRVWNFENVDDNRKCTQLYRVSYIQTVRVHAVCSLVIFFPLFDRVRVYSGVRKRRGVGENKNKRQEYATFIRTYELY